MQPRSQRREHGAEFKAQVLAECQRPGASVAAIALDHGLNVDRLRKWPLGRGTKHNGLPAPGSVPRMQSAAAGPGAASLQFIPAELAPAAPDTDEATMPSASDIHVELIRGGMPERVRSSEG